MRVIDATQALFCAATALVCGCALDQRELGTSPNQASLGFELVTSSGVELDSLRFDVNRPDGADVIDGTLEVAHPGAELTFGVNEMPPGDYELALVAVGMHAGSPSLCTSEPVGFTLASGQRLELPAVEFDCLVQDPANQTWSVSPGVDIAIETLTVGGEAVAFTYSPALAKGRLNAAGSCVYPPIVVELTTFEPDLGVGFGAAPDGAYAGGNPSLPQVTYTCASGGEKTLSLAATRGAETVTKSYVVTCDDSSCLPGGPVCGNGVVESGEECDERSARCVACAIHPRCGDGSVDAPEECDARALPTASCDVNCRGTTTP